MGRWFLEEFDPHWYLRLKKLFPSMWRGTEAPHLPIWWRIIVSQDSQDINAFPKKTCNLLWFPKTFGRRFLDQNNKRKLRRWKSAGAMRSPSSPADSVSSHTSTLSSVGGAQTFGFWDLFLVLVCIFWLAFFSFSMFSFLLSLLFGSFWWVKFVRLGFLWLVS